MLGDAAETLAAVPPRSPDEWASATRVLPRGAAEPGPFKPERTPYMIPVQRAVKDPRVHRITVVCGSQMAKTDTVMNIICQKLDDDPQPIVYVGPTRSNVEKIIEPRLLAAMRSSASLWKKVQRGRAASKTAKRVAGVLLRLAWSGSASELASQEAALGILDELDRMGLDVEGEGSPIELLDARLATYPDHKMVLTSTPTEGVVVADRDEATGLYRWRPADPTEVASPIWQMWQEGTREEWAWPCPHCDEYFVPRFSLLRWPEDAGAARAKREARLCCPACGALIEDRDKDRMNARGTFVAPGQSILKTGELAGEAEPNDHRSFWISGLCSPWKSFGDRAGGFVSAVRSGDINRIKGVVNTQLGEVWQIGGDAPDWHEVQKQRGEFPSGHVPDGALALTCGVDVQKHRLVYAVRAWGYGMESWLVAWGDLWGDTDQADVWAQLHQLRGREFGDRKMPIRRMVIDSGYKPGEDQADHAVYRFCRETGGQAVAAKGHDSLSRPLYAAEIDVRLSGQLIRKGLQLWHLNSDFFKSFVHGRLRLPVDAAAGRWHLPADVSEDYCQQVTAEARVAKASGKATWIRRRRENHALDCEALNVAAAYMLGAHMLQRPEQPKQDAAAGPAPAPQGPPSPRAALNPGARWASAPPAGGPFATSWRK